MLKDRYGNDLDTESTRAQECYLAAVELFLCDTVGATQAFRGAVAADPEFCLGSVALARSLQMDGEDAAALIEIKKSRGMTAGLSAQQLSHLNALELVISGQSDAGYKAVRAHVVEYPRDALVAHTCTSVFGMIGFSGLAGREAELLAFITQLAPHYGNDWWMQSQLAFALCETGQVDRGAALIEKSLAQKPKNIGAVHIKAHMLYESGQAGAGISFLQECMEWSDRRSMLHGHNAWHVTLWLLEQGNIEQMWQVFDAEVSPQNTLAPPINVLTDTASLLRRAEMVGVDVPASRWQTISDYALQFFPDTGLTFVDVHVALAHAMAGNSDALNRVISNPKGPAADVTLAVSSVFAAIAKQDWVTALNGITIVMQDSARIGGSRAQRDLFEHTMLAILLKLNKPEEAKRLITLRRPVIAKSNAAVKMLAS